MKKILLILFLFLLSGCAAKSDLGEQMICQGLSIDRIDDKTMEIAYQILNPSEIAATSFTPRPEVLTYRFKLKNGESGDLASALVLPGKVMLSHVVAIVIGEEVAKKELESVIDRFIRLNEIQSGVKVYVAKDVKAHELLEVLTAAVKIPSQKINTLVQTGIDSQSVAISRTPFEAVNQMQADGVELTLQSITLKGDLKASKDYEKLGSITPHSRIKISGIAVFKENKLIGYLSPEQSVFYNILVGDAKTAGFQSRCRKNKKGLSEYTLTGIKTTVTSKMKNDKINFDVNVEGTGTILYDGCGLSFNEKEMKEIEKEVSDSLTRKLNKTIEVIQKEYKSDVLGYGEIVRRQHKREWKQYKEKWNEHFEKADIHVKSNITITGVGKVKQTITNKKIGEKNGAQ